MKMKTAVFEAARWIAAVAALVLLASMFGGNKVSSASMEDVTSAVTKTLTMDTMVKAENQMVKRLYGIDPAAFEGCVLYYPATNMMAQELLIVKLSDVSQQDAVRQAVEDRLQTQKTTFEGYGVEQFDLLSNHCVIEVRGNFVLFVVNADCASAQKAFLDAL